MCGREQCLEVTIKDHRGLVEAVYRSKDYDEVMQRIKERMRS
jgi:hypothetical protein